MTYKPEHYPSVSPYLLVRNASKTLAFVEEVFAAERLRVYARDDGGGIKHAEARIEDSVIMMGETPEGQCHVHIYVADVDAAFERARVAGGTAVQEPVAKGDGDYRGGIDDGNGVTWWLAQQL